MADATATLVGRPAWVDLSSGDPEASRRFYADLFGWKVEVSPDPQYGGYAMATVGGKDVAGIGPKMMPEAPTAWSVYIGSNDVDALAGQVHAAGGTVIAPPMQVGEQGRMAVFQDPAGAFISAWQAGAMSEFLSGTTNTLGWAELNARGVDRAIPFYTTVFGWDTRSTPMGDRPPYVEFLAGGESIAGAQEIDPGMPPQIPSFWLAYFNVDDVDATAQKAASLGGQVIVPAMDFPGGRFAVVVDPQGATFGLLKFAPREG